MSKLSDVINMYGQDFGISLTNAQTVSQIYNAYEKKKLPKNMLLINVPEGENGNDLNMPTIFATDYNGSYLQLTYAIYTKNGLYTYQDPDPDKKNPFNGSLMLHIDGKTIKENNNKELSVDTNYLSYCSFNNLGVAKVAESISNRTNSSYPTNTFINVDKNGVLYLADSFLSHIYEYIEKKIYINLYPLILDNIKGWLVDKNSINYYPTDKINVSSIDESLGFVITQKYTLEYNSLNSVSESVDIDINSNDYPIKEIILIDNTTRVTEAAQSTKEIKLYKHSLDFTIVFYPNYNLQNKDFLDNQYIIKFQPQSLEGNRSLMFYFNQNNVFDKDSNNLFKPFKIESTTINLNQLRFDKTFDFNFSNAYRYFDDIDYKVEILYIPSNNINNTDDAILLIDKNINNLIESNYNNIRVSLNKTNDENDIYENWKNRLIDVDTKTGIISKLSNISSLYKYILKYSINGERTYTYEDTFTVNYLLTNIYKENNYLTVDNVSIYHVDIPNNYNLGDASIISLTNYDDKGNLIIEQKDNSTEITIRNYNFIYKIFNSLIDQNSLIDGSEGDKYNTSSIFGQDNIENTGSNPKNYKNDVGFLLVFNCNYNDNIFITNGGADNNQKEYTIYNAITYAQNDNGEYLDANNNEIIIHSNENISLPNYVQYQALVYPKPSSVSTNAKSLQILSFIKLDEFILQNSNNIREHSILSKNLNYNLNIYNAQGPTCYINFKFNYGEFFNDHIKIFNINYGSHQDQFNPTSEFIIHQDIKQTNEGKSYNDVLKEIKNDYYNSRFYVGIQEELIDNVIDLDSITWSLTVSSINPSTHLSEQNRIEVPYTICISPNDLSSSPYNANKDSNTYKDTLHKYYIFEINYINEWYDNTNDNITLKVQPTTFSPELCIKYRWKKHQTNDLNTFNYKLDFNFIPTLQSPDLDSDLEITN